MILVRAPSHSPNIGMRMVQEGKEEEMSLSPQLISGGADSHFIGVFGAHHPHTHPKP